MEISLNKPANTKAGKTKVLGSFKNHLTRSPARDTCSFTSYSAVNRVLYDSSENTVDFAMRILKQCPSPDKFCGIVLKQLRGNPEKTEILYDIARKMGRLESRPGRYIHMPVTPKHLLEHRQRLFMQAFRAKPQIAELISAQFSGSSLLKDSNLNEALKLIIKASIDNPAKFSKAQKAMFLSLSQNNLKSSQLKNVGELEKVRKSVGNTTLNYLTKTLKKEIKKADQGQPNLLEKVSEDINDCLAGVNDDLFFEIMDKQLLSHPQLPKPANPIKDAKEALKLLEADEGIKNSSMENLLKVFEEELI